MKFKNLKKLKVQYNYYLWIYDAKIKKPQNFGWFNKDYFLICLGQCKAVAQIIRRRENDVSRSNKNKTVF